MTGGGVENIPRMSENFDYDITFWPSVDEIAPVFKPILQRVDLSKEELFRTFNMGIGLTLLVKKAEAANVLAHLKQNNVKAWTLGSIRKGHGELKMKTSWNT